MEPLVISVVGPAIAYFNQRLNDPMGERFDVFHIFEGASLMDPIVAKNTSHEDVMVMLEKLRTYPTLNKEGEKKIVDGLKRGYRAYRRNARLVPSKFDYESCKCMVFYVILRRSICRDKQNIVQFVALCYF